MSARATCALLLAALSLCGCSGGIRDTTTARAAELLSWWRSTTPDYVEIAYTARHIAKEAELWPTMAA